MTLQRIVLIGIILAAVGAGVIRVRLMTTAAARQVHLLAVEQQRLNQQIWRQQLQLSRLRTPWQIAKRIDALGVDVRAPGTPQDRHASGQRRIRLGSASPTIPVARTSARR